MIVFPNAKINIGLNITEKRVDGYHNIESVFYPVAILNDVLEVVEQKDKSESDVLFSSSGIDIPGNNSDNLCCKAYYLLKKDFKLPQIKIHLHKHIPIGAGLGGGSADAAFFIRLINDKFSLKLSSGQMLEYAAKLGSDCAFFIQNKPVFAEGTGSIFSPVALHLKGYYIVLIYPNIHINTAEAYRGVVPQKPQRTLKEDISNLPVEEWENAIHNQFEDSIFPKYPEIKNIKEKLYSSGALYAAMSGSGSAVYGLFREKPDLKNYFQNYFVVQGILT